MSLYRRGYNFSSTSSSSASLVSLPAVADYPDDVSVANMTVSGMTTAGGKPRCPHHKKKELDLYCKVHKEAICTNCTYTRHRNCTKKYLMVQRQLEAGHVSLDDDLDDEEEPSVGEANAAFLSIHDAAQQLTKEARAYLYDQPASPREGDNDDLLCDAAAEVGARRETLATQLTRHLAHLKRDRDTLIQEIERRYEQHVTALTEAAIRKEAALKQQQEALEGLVTDRRAALEALDSLSVEDHPAELVHLCSKVLKHVDGNKSTIATPPHSSSTPSSSSSPIPIRPVEEANLHLHLPSNRDLLEEIKHRGWAGEMVYDPMEWYLVGEKAIMFPQERVGSMRLQTDNPLVSRPLESLMTARAWVMAEDGHTTLREIDCRGKVNPDGKYEVTFLATDYMLGHEVEVEVTIGGHPIRHGPRRVMIATNSIGSTIFLGQGLRLPLQILLSYLPDKSWKLLYRASRDGWNARDFHARCDHQGPTVSIFKTKETGSVFGGYASVSWESSPKGLYKRDPHAFLFTLVNTANTQPMKLLMKPGTDAKAVFCYSGYGPVFGASCDISICNHPNQEGKCYTNLGSTYKAPAGQNGYTFLAGLERFRLEEMEVFSVKPVGN